MSIINITLRALVVRFVLSLIVVFQLSAPSLAQNSNRDPNQTVSSSKSTTSTLQEQDQSIKLAVVVGIDNYSGLSGVSTLSYAVADAKSLKKTLESQGYSVLALYDGEATAQFIQKAISKIAQLAESDESRRNATLLFSFSGHGFAVDGENYLVTYDTDGDNVTETGYPLSELVDFLGSTGISQKVLFIDACRNNPGQRSASGSFVQQQAEGVGILFSTRAGDVAYESPIVQGGIFSHFLVKGLNGEAVSSEGIVSLHSLKSYVERKVPQWTIENLQTVQTPYQAGEYTGEFRLTHPMVKITEQKPKPNHSRAFGPTLRDDKKGYLNVLLNPVDELAGHFKDGLSKFLIENYEVNIVDDKQSASMIVDMSANSLEITRAGQSFIVEGDLLLEGYSFNGSRNEISHEFVPVKGVSYKTKRLAVNAAAQNWTDDMIFGSTTTAIADFVDNIR